MKIIMVLFFLGLVFAGGVFAGEGSWPGVDTAVVERYARAHGRAPRPFINIEGDLLLFMFTLAGAAGGFVLGYNWKSLFGKNHKL
ncbi:MAG: cobalt transporter [Candidatus Omnitrophota bacterium]